MRGFGNGAATVVLAVSTWACGGSAASPGDVPYGLQFDLKVNESLRVGDDGLRVTFESVKSDSRCPMDALCIQAGDAVVALRLEAGGKTTARDLHTDPARAEATLDRYAVRLVALQPYPRSDLVIAPADYVAALRVDRN